MLQFLFQNPRSCSGLLCAVLLGACGGSVDDGPDGTAGAPNGGSGASAGSSSGGFGGSGASSGSSAVEECAGEGMQLDPVFVGERTRTGGTCADGDHPDASVRMLLGSVDDPERGLDQPVAVFAEAFSGAPFYCNLVDVAECEVRIDCSPEDHPDGDLAHSLSLSIGETTAHGTLTVQDQVAGCEADFDVSFDIFPHDPGS